jgi:hypothetical protein
MLWKNWTGLLQNWTNENELGEHQVERIRDRPIQQMKRLQQNSIHLSLRTVKIEHFPALRQVSAEVHLGASRPFSLKGT